MPAAEFPDAFTQQQRLGADRVVLDAMNKSDVVSHAGLRNTNMNVAKPRQMNQHLFGVGRIESVWRTSSPHLKTILELAVKQRGFHWLRKIKYLM